MPINIEEIEQMSEQEQLLYINRFLEIIQPISSELPLKKKLKILKQYIQKLKNEIYSIEYCMGETSDREKISQYEKMIDSDRLLINEINGYVYSLSKTKKTPFLFFRKKI